jgi:hypothetical protein
MYNDAVHLTLDAHPDKPSRFSNLGISLLARFDRLGDLDDLNKSILVLKDAIGLTPDGHPSKPSYLNNLARCLVRRFAHLGDHADLQQTILHASSAAQSTTGPPHIRFNSAAIWAQCATLEDCHFLEPYQVALDLLPELAWLGLSITDRHYHLLKAGQVIREAAAASVASGHLQRAVEWLEQGRSVIWGQLLNLRSPVETLKTHHPELANQLLFLSAQLEGSGTRASDSEIIRPGTQQSLQSIADRAHENAHNREQLLKQIRELEGFSRFLLPKTISELSQAACQGPVVILNPSDKRCDALILMPDLDGQVIHIPLDDFKPEEAKNMAQSFPHLVGQSGRLTGKREGYVDPEDQFELNLSKLWLGVVKPVLNGLAMTVSHFTIHSCKLNIQLLFTDPNDSQLSTDLVVPNRSSCLSPHSCCRSVWKR